MGNLNKNLETISLSQKYATRLLFIWFFSVTILILYFTLYLLFVFFSLLYSSSFFFFILILCLILFIFFFDMCHSRCYSSLVGQSSIPLSSSSLSQFSFCISLSIFCLSSFLFYTLPPLSFSSSSYVWFSLFSSLTCVIVGAVLVWLGSLLSHQALLFLRLWWTKTFEASCFILISYPLH